VNIDFLPAHRNHAKVLAGIHSICFVDTWSSSAMVDILAMPGAAGVLAVDGGSLVPSNGPPGPAGMAIWRSNGGEAEILTIAVLPPWRRTGLGRRLLDYALNQSIQSRADVMFLEVAVDNYGAQALYQGMGFRQVGRRKGYYADKDALVMRKDLPIPPRLRA
jgi:[ribosomal protein S18]-alanine N-acetyltransferase